MWLGPACSSPGAFCISAAPHAFWVWSHETSCTHQAPSCLRTFAHAVPPVGNTLPSSVQTKLALTQDHSTSECLSCLPMAGTISGFAFICMVMCLVSLSPSRLSPGDGCPGSAFCSPLCTHHLAVPGTG